MGGAYSIFTSSADGHTLYAWGADGSGGANFVGLAKIDAKFIPAHATAGSPTDGNTKRATERP